MVAAQRITTSGLVNGKPVITFRVNWYAGKDIDQDWILRENGWRLLLEGDTPIDIGITFPVSPEQISPAMAGLTAFRVLNAVPSSAPRSRASAPRPSFRTSCRS